MFTAMVEGVGVRKGWKECLRLIGYVLYNGVIPSFIRFGYPKFVRLHIKFVINGLGREDDEGCTKCSVSRGCMMKRTRRRQGLPVHAE